MNVVKFLQPVLSFDKSNNLIKRKKFTGGLPYG